jgi:uncharacterized membrane protein
MPDETTSNVILPGRLRRWLKPALIASLALNALFLGTVISAFVRHGGPLMAASAQSPGNLGAYVATLPTERGKALWLRAGDRRRIMMPLRQEVRRARREALALLTAEPFDKDRFTEAQTRLVEAEHRQRLAQRDMLAELASGLTVEERRAYIRWRGAQPRGAAAADEVEALPAPGTPKP